MKKKNLIILIVAAVVLGLAAVITSKKNSPAAPAHMGEKLMQGINLDDIAKITMTSKNGTTTTLQRGDNGWTVLEKQGYPADFDRLHRAVVSLADAKIQQALELTDQQKADMHISSKAPRVQFRDKDNKLLKEIIIGDVRENGSSASPYAMPTGRFISTDGGQTVLVVSENFYSFANPTPSGWLDHNMLNIATPDIESITVTGPGRDTIKISRDKDKKLALSGLKPDEEPNRGNISQLENAVSYMNFDDIADTSATNNNFGLDKPVVYEVITKGHLRYTIKIGNKVKGKAGRYAQISAAFVEPPTSTNAVSDSEQAKLSDAKTKAADFNTKFSKWVYTIPAYKADSMTKLRKDLVKAKEKPKAENKAQTPQSGTPPAKPEVDKAKVSKKVEKKETTGDKKAAQPVKKSQPAKEDIKQKDNKTAPATKTGATTPKIEKGSNHDK